MLLSFSPKEIEMIVDEKKFRPVDIPILWGDPSLLRERFKLQPDFKIKQTLFDLLNHWRERVKR